MTETEIKVRGMEILSQSLGLVEAERFVSLMQREPFDYTAWRKVLFANLTVEQINELAEREYSENS
jgi:hypothetical protein